jgi:hypothetical protein
MPNFVKTGATAPRLPGDFSLAPSAAYAPNAAELDYLTAISDALAQLAADDAADIAARYPENLFSGRQAARKAAMAALDADAENFVGGRNPTGDRTRLNAALADYTAGIPKYGAKDATEPRALFVDINKALTVVRTVCERLDERSQRGLRGWLFGPNAALQRRARLLQAEFLEKLHGVAWIGLELEFTSMAKLTLEEIRREFFAREADRIKSIYTRRLGAWASATAALLLLAYIMIYTGKYPSPWAFDHKSFLLAASGAAIGAWTSFSALQVQFSFDDLIMVDEGTYDPPMRILFVIVLTMAACLLFWNGAINLEIGNLKTQAEPFRQSGSVALLIGLFCGLSERALATAIAGRAAAFVKGISSGA